MTPAEIFAASHRIEDKYAAVLETIRMRSSLVDPKQPLEGLKRHYDWDPHDEAEDDGLWGRPPVPPHPHSTMPRPSFWRGVVTAVLLVVAVAALFWFLLP
jgi:hypothetical protein